MLMPPAPSVLDQIAYAQLTDLLCTVLPEEDFRLLLEIADGHSYSDMASAHHKTVSSLKAKVFRVREKVKNSRISASLRSWPRHVRLELFTERERRRRAGTRFRFRRSCRFGAG